MLMKLITLTSMALRDLETIYYLQLYQLFAPKIDQKFVSFQRNHQLEFQRNFNWTAINWNFKGISIGLLS